jgi:hypothetical protein
VKEAAALTAQCSLQGLEDALGPSAADVMPELARLAQLRVTLPRYQTLMLSKLAEREQLPLGDFLARHLLDLACSESEWLAEAIPQFTAALRWPEV